MQLSVPLFDSLLRWCNKWLFFSFSDKAKFAIKVALSMTLAYLFILSNGLEYSSVAAITIMLIATPEGIKDSIQKGLLRIAGTIVGALIGMGLITLFPQEPLHYLCSLSIVVTLILYLRNAYTGDNTFFMLGAMTTMAVFDGGEVADVFMYGIDRTLITIIAISIYTLVFLLIWPSQSKQQKEASNTTTMFVWLDSEHIKGALQSFLVFWLATAIWYFFNPPGGFMLVMLATGFSAITSFSPVKPSIMAIAINISLLIAIIIYIFILPNLVHWIELSLVIFIYTFFAFYFFPPMISVIILIGINTLMITNSMSYHVDVFLGIVLLMDMVFALLIFVYYFPFSTKPEHLYLTLLKRYIHISALRYHPSKLIQWYVVTHHKRTYEKLLLWSEKIDFNYFNTISQEQLNEFHHCLQKMEDELFNSTPSDQEKNLLIALFQAWERDIEQPSKLSQLESDLFHTPLQERLVECHQHLSSIEWNHLRQGRF